MVFLVQTLRATVVNLDLLVLKVLLEQRVSKVHLETLVKPVPMAAREPLVKLAERELLVFVEIKDNPDLQGPKGIR